jgi:hypothetical protein
VKEMGDFQGMGGGGFFLGQSKWDRVVSRFWRLEGIGKYFLHLVEGGILVF